MKKDINIIKAAIALHVRNAKKNEGFLSLLTAPARRALENKGITTLKQLSAFSEKDILQLHGTGKSSIPKLKIVLAENGLYFKSE